MEDLLNLMRREAERAVRGRAAPRGGIVTSYDPSAHAVKVVYPASGAESGWMPVRHAAVGAGWGLVCGPPIGAQAVVDFLDGDIDCPFVAGFLNSGPDTPHAVPSGELHLRHVSGAEMVLCNDGSCQVSAGVVRITGTADVIVTAPVLHVEGDLMVSGEISDRRGLHGSFGTLREAYNAHEHPDAQGGDTGLTNRPVP